MSTTNHDKLLELINSLPDFCINYFSYIQNLNIKTRTAYAGDLKGFFHYLEKYVYNKEEISLLELQSLEAYHIDNYLSHIKCYQYEGKTYTNSEVGIRRKLTTLKSFFRYLRETRKIDTNPMDLVTLYKRNSEPGISNEIPNMVLRADEQTALIDEAINGQHKSQKALACHDKIKYRDTSILALFLHTGISLSELVSLDIADVDMQSHTLIITKERKQKVHYDKVQLDPETYNALYAYINEERNNLLTFSKEELLFREYPDGPLFVSLKHNRVSLRQVENIVKSYAKNVLPGTVKVTPNMLRKTFLHNQYNGNEELFQLLGYKKNFSYISEEKYEHNVTEKSN